MPYMTIKSIPEKLYQSLKISARTNHRSLNGEAIACLERSLGLTRLASEAVLEKIDQLRKNLKSIKLTDKVLREARMKQDASSAAKTNDSISSPTN